MKQGLRLAKLIISVSTVVLKLHYCLVSSNAWALYKVAFVPPTKQTKFIRLKSVGYNGRVERPADVTVLQLSKKKAGPVSVKKIQVKMLKYVEGTGHVGEIVMVTPAFFQNKLRPSASAVMITDEEVTKAKLEAEVLEKETRDKAEALKERLDTVSILLRRKAGPDGHLFGGIGPKCIMEELETTINDDFLKQKSVKIISITNEDGSEMNGDIKHTGIFKASLSLTKEVSGSFGIIVEAERQ
jgi:large subunit ribosomal protein L9